jgi:hypothetical protein
VSEITVNSRIPFGQRGRFGSYGRRVRDLSDKFLRWIVANADKDPMALYASAAKEALAGRARGEKEFQIEDDLQAQADAILLRAGAGELVPNRRRK